MAGIVVKVSPGEDLFRVAAQLYGDPMGFTLLMRANNLSDPFITRDMDLVVPDYSATRANDGNLGG